MGNARSVIKRLRNLEEMMQERGLFVDHSTIHRWIVKLVPVLEEAFRKRKRKRGIGAVGKSWRLDETYIKIRGEDRYWYRAVDKQGTPSTSCSPPNAIVVRRGASSRAPSRTTAFPRSSTSTRAARTKLESRTTIGRTARRW